MSEFTPINRGYHNSIQRHLKAAPNGYKPSNEFEAVYEGIDILPTFWKVPEGHVDVHAIAIASTYAAPELDHSWVDDNDNNDVEEAENSRRMLRKASTERLFVSEKEDSNEVKVYSMPENSRSLNSDEVIPGQGWGIYAVGGEEITGYCDGSPMSFNCKRSKNRNCLLSGHNDARGSVNGDGLSGWVVITVPDVKEGLIFARLQVSYVVVFLWISLVQIS
jgi:hypothetical protein